MTDTEYTQKVTARVNVIAPEAAKVKAGVVDVAVEDAIYDCKIAFQNQTEAIKVRAAAYLAAHYIAVNLFQEVQAGELDNYMDKDPGEVTETIKGGEKVVQYKDKRMEWFEKKTSTTTGNAMVKWAAKITESNNPLIATTYGQEFLRLLKLYNILEPFLLGNFDPLGRSDYGPGDRYRKW